MILKTSDFTGIYKISKNQYTEIQLLDELFYFQNSYLSDMLGDELYKLFLSDLVNDYPTTQRFIDIFEPLKIEVCKTELKSKGIKEMLLGFSFFEFVRKQHIRNTVSGNVVNNNDLGTPASNHFLLVSMYNKTLDTYSIIQEFIKQNIEIYPEFKGIRKEYTL